MSNNINEQSVLDALKSVTYPGEELNIVSSGMVQDDLTIEDGRVSFSILFKRAKDPFHKSVLKAAEHAVREEVGEGVEVEITPIFPELKPVVEPKLLPQVKNIIAVSSGKGGVGKSTITANLAVALANAGYKVGVLDADIYGPSQPRMLNLEGARPHLVETEGRELIEPAKNYGVRMLSIGFFVNPEDAVVWRGTMASNAMSQLIRDGNWGELDYFLIDLPPGTSDIHLTLVQSLGVTGAVVVTTPQDVALDDARKGISMFQEEKISVPVLGLVENMSWFTPAELPDNRYYIFGKDGGAKLAKETGTKLLGQVPLVQSVREGADKGEPVALKEDTIMGLAFKELASELVKAVDERWRDLPPTHKVKMNR
ncbi:MAG: Mrp/NBP35 family ATP-binding protein [Porphyromonas sp.]|nr:Mrp/NBP35 family ATP-binding protein [Porphyromonas sp.]